MVGTTEAAELLNISTRRLRCLLSQNRVHGAYKSGRGWVIPLVKGYPKIRKASRGPKPTWKKVQTPGKSFVHINRKFIGKKNTDGEYVPPISLKSRGKNIYSSRVVIPGPCVIVYQYENRMPGCKATAWIETFSPPKAFNGCSFEEIIAELKKVELEKVAQKIS